MIKNLLTLGFLGVLGVVEGADGCTGQSSNKKYAGITIKLMGPPWMPSGGWIAQTSNNPKYAGWMRTYADKFENATGAKVILEVLDYGDTFFSAVEGDLKKNLKMFNAYMYYPGNMFTPYLKHNHVQDLTDLVRADSSISWQDIFPNIRDAVATYQDRIWIIPVDGNALFLVYYADLFKEHGYDKPPDTWEDLLELTKKFYGKGKRPDGRGDMGACFYTDPGASMDVPFFTILAPYVQTEGSFGPKSGTWWNTETLKPLMDSEAGKYAAGMWQEFVRHSAHQYQRDYGLMPGSPSYKVGFFGMIDWFLKGKCLWFMAFPGNVKEAVIQFQSDPTSVGEINVYYAPGTTKVMDRSSDTGALSACTVENCPYATAGTQGSVVGSLVNHCPYYGMGGGEVLGMRYHEDPLERQAVFDLISYYASPDVSKIGTLRTPLDPFRYSHVNTLDDTNSEMSKLYADLGWTSKQRANFKKTCTHVFATKNVGFDISVDDNTIYRNKLNIQLQLLADGDISMDAFMSAVKDTWASHTLSLGFYKQLNDYRSQLKLPPILEKCPLGMEPKGSSSCQNCTIGKYKGVEDYLPCTVCSVGMYQNVPGQTSCKRCQVNGAITQTTAAVGSTSHSQCVCKKGFFHQCMGDACSLGVTNPDMPGFCQSCIKGMVCEGPEESAHAMVRDVKGTLEHRPPFLEAGTMAFDGNSFKCAGDGKACPGAFLDATVAEMCTAHSSGVACAFCDDGYSFDGNLCSECSSEGGRIPAVIFVATFVLLAIALQTRPPEPLGTITRFTVERARFTMLSTTTMSFIMSFVQLTFLCNSTGSILWPKAVGKVFSGTGSLFDLSAFQVDCFSANPKEGAILRTVFVNVIPAVAFLVLAIAYALGKFVPRTGTKNWPDPARAISVSLGLFATFFMVIASSAINTSFAKFTHVSGKQTLRFYPFLLSDSDEAMSIQMISIVGIVAWCVLGLSLVMFLMCKLPSKAQDLYFRRCTGAIVVPYRPQAPCWFLVIMIHQLLLVLAMTIFEDGIWQMTYMLMVLSIYLCALCNVRPYYCMITYVADCGCTLGRISLLVLGMPYQVLGEGDGLVLAVVVVIYIMAIALFTFVVYLFFTGKAELDKILVGMGGNIAITLKVPQTGNFMEIVPGWSADEDKVDEDTVATAAKTAGPQAVEEPISLETEVSV